MVLAYMFCLVRENRKVRTRNNTALYFAKLDAPRVTCHLASRGLPAGWSICQPGVCDMQRHKALQFVITGQ